MSFCSVCRVEVTAVGRAVEGGRLGKQRGRARFGLHEMIGLAFRPAEFPDAAVEFVDQLLGHFTHARIHPMVVIPLNGPAIRRTRIACRF